MAARKVATILGAVYLALLVFILRFGQVTGYGPKEHEGRVIDVIVKALVGLFQ